MISINLIILLSNFIQFTHIFAAFCPPPVDRRRLLTLRKTIQESPLTVTDLDLSPVPNKSEYDSIRSFPPITHSDEEDSDSTLMFDMNLGSATVKDTSYFVKAMKMRKPQLNFVDRYYAYPNRQVPTSKPPSLQRRNYHILNFRPDTPNTNWGTSLPPIPVQVPEKRTDGKKLVKKLKTTSHDEDFYFGGFPGSELSINSDEDVAEESEYELIDESESESENEGDVMTKPRSTAFRLSDDSPTIPNDEFMKEVSSPVDSDEEFLAELRKDMKNEFFSSYKDTFEFDTVPASSITLDTEVDSDEEFLAELRKDMKKEVISFESFD